MTPSRSQSRSHQMGEEYFPYGKSSDRRDERNRYRYIGVERDEATGLMMTGPRGIDSVTGRFLQGDPVASHAPSASPFLYGDASPLLFVDSSGRTAIVALPGCTQPPTLSDAVEYSTTRAEYLGRTPLTTHKTEGIIAQVAMSKNLDGSSGSPTDSMRDQYLANATGLEKNAANLRRQQASAELLGIPTGGQLPEGSGLSIQEMSSFVLEETRTEFLFLGEAAQRKPFGSALLESIDTIAVSVTLRSIDHALAVIDVEATAVKAEEIGWSFDDLLAVAVAHEMAHIYIAQGGVVELTDAQQVRQGELQAILVGKNYSVQEAAEEATIWVLEEAWYGIDAEEFHLSNPEESR